MEAVHEIGGVKVITASIPQPEREQLARNCLEFVQRLLAEPGGRAAIDNWKKEHGLD